MIMDSNGLIVMTNLKRYIMSQTERFYELLEKMQATHDAKRHDYANTDDVFANFRTCELAGIPAWKGCCIRIGDKFSRIMGFAKKEKLEVKDESIKDTLIDLANYSIIALILYEEEERSNHVKLNEASLFLTTASTPPS